MTEARENKQSPHAEMKSTAWHNGDPAWRDYDLMEPDKYIKKSAQVLARSTGNVLGQKLKHSPHPLCST